MTDISSENEIKLQRWLQKMGFEASEQVGLNDCFHFDQDSVVQAASRLSTEPPAAPRSKRYAVILTGVTSLLIVGILGSVAYLSGLDRYYLLNKTSLIDSLSTQARNGLQRWIGMTERADVRQTTLVTLAPPQASKPQ